MAAGGDAATADEIFQRALTSRGLVFRRGADGTYSVSIGGGEARIDLENVRRDFARDKDAGAVLRFAERVGPGLLDGPPDWDAVMPFVRYSLEPSDHEGGFGDTLHEPVAEGLTKVFVFTSPDGSRINWIAASTLTSWNVSRDVVVARANENMDRLASEAKLETRDVGGVEVGMLATGETAFKASLILSPRFRDVVAPALDWPVLVVVPARDFAFVISAKDRSFLGRLGPVVVEEFNGSGHPVSRDVLEVGDGGVDVVASFAVAPR